MLVIKLTAWTCMKTENSNTYLIDVFIPMGKKNPLKNNLI